MQDNVGFMSDDVHMRMSAKNMMLYNVLPIFAKNGSKSVKKGKNGDLFTI